MPIIARAPTRIDLAGGTTDLWPLYLFLEGGVTINAAIDLYATAQIEPLADHRVEIVSRDQNRSVTADGTERLDVRSELPLLCRLARFFAPSSGFRLTTESGVPAGSGLGGSSTLAIAVCGALNEFTGAGFDREQLIEISRDIEAQVLGIPTGEQDYYAAVYGGLNAWHFGIRQVHREVPGISTADLQGRLLLFYSGLPRSSGINNWKVFKQYVDGDARTRESLAEINRQSGLLLAALRTQDWDSAAAAIASEWEARKRLAPAITSPEIEEILDFGTKHGARAGKVCGAGGGGCLFLLIDPDTRPHIEHEGRSRGLRLLDFHIAGEGLSVQRS